MNIPEMGIEAKILEAIAKGQLENLAGAGKPLRADLFADVPDGFRVSYRVLQNSNMVPSEVSMLRAIHDLKRQLLNPKLSADEKLDLERHIVFQQSAMNMKLESMQRKS